MPLHGMAFPILLVFSTLPGLSPDIPAQECTERIPFPGTDLFYRPANASAGYYKQYTIASDRHSCRTHRPSLHGTFRADVSLLYIKQPYTLPGVSRCQPPNSLHKITMDVRLTKLEKTSLSSPNRLHTKFKLRLTACFH